ncbi:hypothetical protein [Acinetobacter seifertii]|uniref:hypothetical protein n=1 Tax=Acinetobacter seifertii TaxID=1530123 RepID=UPI0020900631|nr:hypothetical protein [Acinetobacter seifertii]
MQNDSNLETTQNESVIKWIDEQILLIEADERFKSKPASIFSNAPLALIQTELSAKRIILVEIREKLVHPLLQNDCMIGQTWFMKGTPVANLIKHSEKVYQAEAIAQNSKIKFGTDDNRSWFAHDVPFFGTVQMDQIEEHGIVEWDIHFNECWQGPFNSKARCIQHLEECIQEMREEQAQEGKDHV